MTVPVITKDPATGVFYLQLPDDPTAEGYSFVTPHGPSRTFDPSPRKIRLGADLPADFDVQLTTLDVAGRPPVTVHYPGPAPPPPIVTPLMDFRATVVTKMVTAGLINNVTQYIEPWGAKVTCTFMNADITVIDDPLGVWGKVFRNRINQFSRNPWWSAPDNRRSCEITYRQVFTEGQHVFYANSVCLRSGEQYLPVSVGDGWLLFNQDGYLGITSPTFGKEIRKGGLGVDANPGFYDTAKGTTPTDLIVRADQLWPLADFTRVAYLDTIDEILYSLHPVGVRRTWGRVHGSGKPFVVVHEELDVITAQTGVNGQFATDGVDKQGLYKGYLPLSRALPDPAFEVVVDQRGLTKHATLADAQAALS